MLALRARRPRCLPVVLALLALAAFEPATAVHNGTATAPDLKVDGAVLSAPATIRPGDVPTFSVTVHNAGDAAAGNFSVRFRLDGSVTLGDVPFRGTLAPGARTNVTSRPWWNATAGNHSLVVTLDVFGSIVEHRENNNAAALPFAVVPNPPRPDLVPEGPVRQTPLGINPGDQPTFTVGVRNKGTAAAGDFSVRFLVDGAVPVGDVPFRGSLAPGARVNITSRPWWNATLGNHTLDAVVDAFGSIAEQVETNNALRQAFRAGYADLVSLVGNITPASPVAGQSVQFSALVENRGVVAADRAEVKFALEPLQGESPFLILGNVTAPPLLPGGRVELRSPPWLAAQYGDYLLVVTADPNQLEPEGSLEAERNNEAERSFHVRAPDFVVKDLWLDPPSPVVEQPAVFHALIANIGDAGAGANVRLFDEHEGNLSSPRRVVLAPGESTEVSFSWTASLDPILVKPWERHVVAWVDHWKFDAEVVEIEDFQNNFLRKHFEVRAPDLAVASADIAVRATPLVLSLPNPLASHTVEVTVHNRGTAATLRDYYVVVEACARGPLLAPHGPCEVAANLTGSAGQQVGVGVPLQDDWNSLGDLGDYTFCATIHYPGEQLATANDRACVDGAVIVTLGGRGVRLLP